MLLEDTGLGKSEWMNEDREYLIELYKKSYAALFKEKTQMIYIRQ